MDGFNKLPKMQCFKEGGSVKTKMPAFMKKESKSEGKKDLSQDKAMIKKGVKQHESALHKGEPKTELKLKTGGRAKKAAGTVKKFEKASGEYGAKKTAQDKKNIAGAKKFVPAFKDGGKACAPSAAKKAKMACGGKAKKMQSGGVVDVKDPQALVDKIALEENTADANIIPNALKTVKRVGKKAIKTAKDMLSGEGAVSDAERKTMEPVAKRNGGKIKKYAEGGSVFSKEEEEWLGGADRTDPYILARMRSAVGPKKQAYVPNANPAMDNRDVGQTAAPNMQETSADLDPYGVTRQETSADLDPYGAANPAPAPAPVRRAPVRRPVAKQAYVPNANPAMDNRDVGQKPAGNIFSRFFNSSPSDQAAQFRRSAEQRKRIGAKIGDSLGLNKKPVS
jgi:hypothetical protein